MDTTTIAKNVEDILISKIKENQKLEILKYYNIDAHRVDALKPYFTREDSYGKVLDLVCDNLNDQFFQGG